jgi:polyadenylate-binding protein
MSMNAPQGGMMGQMNYYNQGQPNSMSRGIPSVDNVLFVADLPDEACEEDLANFFKAYNFSLAKIFHNVLRTHAFVHFQSGPDAEKARLELNGAKISAKYANNKIAKPIRLCRYETKQSQGDLDLRSNLLVKNISKEISAHAFWNLFRAFGDIRSCKLVVDMMGVSKGFGYINYYRVDDAERAKGELNEKDINGKLLKVTNLLVGRHVEKKRNNLYVKNIPKDDFSDEDLRETFEKFGQIKSAVVLKDAENKSKGFGFVCFENAPDAEIAFNEMNNKQVFQNLEPLYVNFAMKKSERQELLLKKREEMFKLAQRMTVFVKIKDENSVKDEEDFEKQIHAYLNSIMNKEYKPKSIKVKIETKNAFITMNSQRDAEEFIKKFQDFSKDKSTNLFFNLYKSKIERINTNAYFKKYNNFNKGEDVSGMMGKMNIKGQPGQQPRYKTFNDMGNMNEFQQTGQDMNKMRNSQTPFKSYNNFDDNSGNNMNMNVSNMNQRPLPQQQFNQFNNATPVPQQQFPQKEISTFNPKLMDEDSVGEYIYNIVETIYPEDNAKITGMLMELDIGVLRDLIGGKREDLIKLISTAHKQLTGKK